MRCEMLIGLQFLAILLTCYCVELRRVYLVLQTPMLAAKSPYFLVLSLCGRSNVAPFDVRIYDVRARVLSLDVGRTALSTTAGTIVTRVQPGHILHSIVPDANCQYHYKICS
jgi:hypothetical protein